MAQFNITITEKLLHGLFLSNGRDEAFSKLLEEIFNQVLLAQSSEQVGAEPYERTEERTAYRNGFRDRQMTTRVGTLLCGSPGIAMVSFLQSCLPDINAVNKP
jgi:putative transposase